MRKIKYQLIKVLVTQAKEQVKFQVETDKLYDRVLGLYVSTPNYRANYGSTLEMKIAEDEIFPEGFETKLIVSTQSVGPNQRFMMFEADETIEAKGSLIVGKYTDGGYDTSISYPYTLILYMKLQKDTQNTQS